MKKNFSYLLIILIAASSISIIDSSIAESNELIPADYYALIINGAGGEGEYGLPSRNDTQYMYHVLSEHYSFDGITYLSVYPSDPGVNAAATLSNIKSAITNTLTNWSDENDTVLIYFSGHGGGWLYHTDLFICDFYGREIPLEVNTLPFAMSGRYDNSGDEGNEIQEGEVHVICFQLNGLYDIDNDGHRDDRVRNFDGDPCIEIDIDDDGTIEYRFGLGDLDGDGWADDMYLDPDRDDHCDLAIDADVDHDGQIDNFVSDGEDFDNDGFIDGADLNNDGDFNDWFGIDECILIQVGENQYEVYWDDEFADDVNTIECKYLIIIIQSCRREGNWKLDVQEKYLCHGGGFIDDLSAPNRIVITSANETFLSWASGNFSFWSKAFIDALHGEKAYYNPQTQEIVHTGVKVDADLDDNGYVSLLEAWQYAWDHDDARLQGLETPWFDDDGDGLPTFISGSDHLDADGQGDLASQIVLEPNLVTILDHLGFTNIEESTVETFSPGMYEVRLQAEFAAYHAVNNLSWYPVGTENYNLIFSGEEGHFGYVEPPVTKTFVANTEFGLSFCSPYHRYFTETSENPDGLKHAQVYVNLDNPDMFFIGFENLYGQGDKDFNDMVISLEIVNRPPNTPSKPSGPTSGYTGSSYTYSTSTTDPDGDSIYYIFDWDDGSTTTVGPYSSGTSVSASHTWSSSGTYHVTVKAKDVNGLLSDWSAALTVTISSSGGGGGGCPTLFSWNGSAFVKEALLDIHSDQDVTVDYTLEHLMPVDGLCILQLRELDNFTSHIDYVKLYAVDENGNWYKCSLIFAWHSQLRLVTTELLYDDSTRVDLTPQQKVWLIFLIPNDIDNVHYFVFELNGYNMKTPLLK